MYIVGHDIVEQALIVRDNHRSVILTLEARNTRSHDTQCVDIETRVSLIQDSELWIEHSHLEYLVLLLLATREALVYGA